MSHLYIARKEPSGKNGRRAEVPDAMAFAKGIWGNSRWEKRSVRTVSIIGNHLRSL
jgi:hypothetical protein